jgi:GNAT superfamily N-acetyltransferase
LTIPELAWPTMVALEPKAARGVLSWLGPGGPGLLALRHALIFGRPGLWADDARSPQGVLLVREGDGQLEAFGAGRADEAVRWLVGRGRRVALVAPGDWEPVIRAEVGTVEIAEVETFVLRDRDRFRAEWGPGPLARRLRVEDGPAFEAIAPAWALRGWGSFAAMIEHGSAFGVPGPGGEGLVALAWVFDATERFDAAGVFTIDRLRGLGLGRRAATALVEHALMDRGKIPLWSTSPANEASRYLAVSLGFSDPVREPLWWWGS